MVKQILSKIVNNIPLYRELLLIKKFLVRVNADLNLLREDVTALRMLEVTRCLDLDLPQHPRYGDPLRLQQYAHQINSQNGEDGIIREIFRRIGSDTYTFVEIGVGNGRENNTAFLLSQGWTGFWFDGTPNHKGALKQRPDLEIGCLKTCTTFLTQENVTDLFEHNGVPKEVDLLSIDIDQNTYYLWAALGEYKARVVVVEYNASIPPDVDWKVHYSPERSWDRTFNFGASLKAFETLGRQLGYCLVGCDFTGTNAFFVRQDLVADRFAQPFSAENHYEPPRGAFRGDRGHPRSILDRQERHQTHSTPADIPTDHPPAQALQ